MKYGLKRIEAFIQSERQREVVDALAKEGVVGLVVTQSLGRGSGERPWIGGAKGHRIEYNSIDTIVTIVEDSKVDSVMSAIANAAQMNTEGDGKIFVTNVEDVMDIKTKKRGSNAL